MQPKINVNVVSNIILSTGDEYGTAAMLSTAKWGLEGLNYVIGDSGLRYFSSFKDVENAFKEGPIVDGARLFFANGGKQLYIIRVNPNAVNASLDTYSGGNPSLRFKARYPGSYGNNIAVTILENSSDANKRDITITDGEITETYTGLATADDVKNAIHGNSALVIIEDIAQTPGLPDVMSKTYLTGGDDGSVTNNDVVTYFQNYLWLVDYDYLITPGFTDDALHASISTLLDSRASQENLYSIYITGTSLFEDISTTLARTATNSNGRLVVVHTSVYSGDGDYYDPSSWRDASYTACAYAGMLCSLPVEKSPTYKEVGFIGTKSILERFYTSTEREQLISAGFTIFDRLTSNKYGCVMAVTRNGNNTYWTYMLDSRRKVDYLTSKFIESTKTYIGQPNDEITRKNIRSSILSILAGARDDRIVTDYDALVTQGLDPREVDVNVTVKLVNEVDYININLTLTI